MNNYAYITLLNDDAYMDGFLGLYQSFLATKSLYPFIVIVSKNREEHLSISLENMEILNVLDIIVEVRYEFEVSDAIRAFNAAKGLSVWNKCFDKFHIFTMTYDRILYLDADTYILQNLDHLFTTDVESEIVCAVDPAVLFNIPFFKDYTIINAGVMLFTPSQELFDKLLQLLNEYNALEEVRDIISDQFIIDRYLLPRPLQDQNIGLLDNTYNIFAPYFLNYKINIEDIRVLHFAGMKKPWLMNKQEIDNAYSFFIYRYLYELERFKRSLRMDVNL